MTTTPKMIRLGPRSSAILDALREQLNDHYSSESALLSEATRRGLLLMAVEAWHEEAGQYGGYNARDLARQLKHELMTVFAFLVEQAEIPPMFRLLTHGPVAAPSSDDARAATSDSSASIPSDAAFLDVPIDPAAHEVVQLGGQDEDWEDEE